MSIFISTPCYGGQATVPYMESLLTLQGDFMVGNISHELLITKNESLITRARNTTLTHFMKSGLDKLLFIDADIEFCTDDVVKLWNMDKDVAVAAYPMKRRDEPLSAWVEGKLCYASDFDGLTKVDYAGTGYMMIDRSVIERMIRHYPELTHTESVGTCWALFDTCVWNDTYLSEDYAFCQRWRDMGGEIWMDPSIKLVHWGTYAYGSTAQVRH